MIAISLVAKYRYVTSFIHQLGPSDEILLYIYLELLERKIRDTSETDSQLAKISETNVFLGIFTIKIPSVLTHRSDFRYGSNFPHSLC